MNIKTLLLFTTIPVLAFCGWGTTRVVKAVTFEQQCGGYLKRAAEANSIGLAKGELARAISYLDNQGMTSGYTSVLWRTPNEDVGFWHTNLRAALDELESTPAEATSLERSNVLIKLRETLMSNGSEGDKLTAPDGIYVFPSNTLFFWWGWLSFGTLVAMLVIAWTRDDWY